MFNKPITIWPAWHNGERVGGELTTQDRRELWQQFILFFLPALAAILAGTWMLGLTNEHAAMLPLQAQEREFVALANQRLDDELDGPLRHVQALSQEEAVKRVYQSSDGLGVQSMEQAFASLLARNPSYLTVRWIDRSGQERVRVDWDAAQQLPIVRKDLLNKAHRYFFQDAIQSPPDKTYISRLDLLEDKGQLVSPPVPTYRVGRRVFGVHGEDKGLVLINVGARVILEKMGKSAGPILARLMMVNAQGQWLLSPDKGDEWGHLLNHPGVFGDRYPKAWQAIRSEAKGQRELDDGLWTWSTVDVSQTSSSPIQTHEVWKIASRLTPDMLQQVHRAAWLPVGLGAALLTLVAALASLHLARANVLRQASRQAALHAEEESRSTQLRLEAQRSFRTVFDSNTSGLVVADAAGQLVMVNREAERMFGYAPGELLGQPIGVLLPPELVQSHQAWVGSYLQNPSTRRMGEGRALAARRKDGSPITLEIGLSHFREGDKDFALANVTDVSAHKLEEQIQQYRNNVLRLLAEGAQMESVLQSIVAGIEAMSPGALCSILVLDPADGRLLLGAAQSLPDDYNQAIHGLQIGDGVGSCGTAAFRRERVVAEDLLVHPYWQPFQDLVIQAGLRACWSQPILDSRRDVLGTFAIYHRAPGRPSEADIALITEASNLAAIAIERNRNEQVLSHHRDHLEELVEERSKEIKVLNRQLEQRALEAEQASRAKGDFLATMSHEIRTPMNAIIGMTHLALKTELTAMQAGYLEKVMRSARLLLNIINDILDLSKIEAGRLVIENRPFDLDTLLETLANQLVEMVSRKKLELLFDVGQDIPSRLVGDEFRLGQVLLNLGSNAVKFTQAGEVVIRARLRALAESDVTLRFEVQDTGIGISQEEQHKLFESFVQADTSISRKYGGTGLGLAISRRLTELMGGEIGFDSVPGKGSTFWVEVPMQVASKEVRSLTLSQDLRHLRVLVADDNLTSASFVQAMLERMSFDAQAVHSGAEALQALQAADQDGKPYSLLVLDWAMPEMDGEAVARRLPLLGLRQLPRLLVLAGLEASDITQQASSLGAQRVMQKPVTGSGLFDAVMATMSATPAELSQRVTEAVADVSAIAGARVLLVEDNLLNQEVATAFLLDAQLVVDIAENGRQAIDKVRRNSYDLVLMDMQMPEVDGLSATRAIRAMDAKQALPIVAMTANAMEGDRERCLAAGMNDYIAKPIDPGQLVDKLLQWIPADFGRRRVEPVQAVPPSAKEVRTQPSIDPVFQGIEGLDEVRGMHLAGMREALYRRLLLRFVEGHEQAVTRVGQAIADQDTVSAERIAHALKGAAAQVGAEAVSQAARELEVAIHDHLPTQSPLQRVEALMGPLIKGLRERFMEPQVAPSASGAHMEQWLQLKEQIISMLNNGHGGAVQFIHGHRDLVRAGMGRSFDALWRAVSEYDFDRALDILARLEDAKPGVLP